MNPSKFPLLRLRWCLPPGLSLCAVIHWSSRWTPGWSASREAGSRVAESFPRPSAVRQLGVRTTSMAAGAAGSAGCIPVGFWYAGSGVAGFSRLLRTARPVATAWQQSAPLAWFSGHGQWASKSVALRTFTPTRRGRLPTRTVPRQPLAVAVASDTKPSFSNAAPSLKALQEAACRKVSSFHSIMRGRSFTQIRQHKTRM